MRGLSTSHIRSVRELRSQADAWDDLWSRSEVTAPTARAELIAHWVDHFAPGSRFLALTVRQGDRLVAALPLVTRRKRHVFQCWDIPGNEWTSAGQLLLDPDCHVPRVCGLLAAEMAELPCAAFWFASVPVDAPYWRALVDALGRVGLNATVQPRYQVGRLVVASASDRQPVHASRQFRRRMERAVRDLERTGTVRLRRESPRESKLARELLTRGLRLEHAGWKGRQKTSVLTRPDTTEFYLQQAEHLARWSQLEFLVLEHSGRAIAFEYGWHAKQVYHSFKVAYDEQYRRHSPGQLLLWMLLEESDQNMLPRAIDFLGPLDDAVRRWHPDCYRVGRILVPHRGLVGKTIAWASGMWLPDPVPLSPTVDVER